MPRRAPAACLMAVLLAFIVSAKRLPIRTYSTADGLARDNVLCIFPDSRGFLWFCTAEGLSRFDGYQFENYGTANGLPDNTITSFVQTRKGTYWLATPAGVCRFDPDAVAGSRFHCRTLKDGTDVRPPIVLYEDSSGTLWCGAAKSAHPRGSGLFRLTRDG